MGFLRNDRRLGANLRRPRGIGMAFPFQDVIQDFGVAQSLLTNAPLTTDSGTVVQDAPQPGDVISDPIAPPAPNVAPQTTVVTDPSGSTVAMPAATTATTPATTAAAGNATDGSAPITSPMTAPDNTVVPIGSTVIITPNGDWVISYPDGSSRIIYKDQPIVDPECTNVDTQDINNGLYCQYNVGVPGKTDYSEYRYIPTERWTGQVQSAGELRANMALAASLNAQFPDSARWNVYFNNPSWHGILGGDLTKLAQYHDDYVPTYIGPTTTSGGNTMAVVMDDGTPIDVTDSSTVTPDQQQQIIDAVYGPVADRAPGQPGYVQPVYSGPPIDDNGVVIQPPSGGGSSSGGGGGPTMYPPTGGVSPTLNDATPSGGGNTGLLIAAGLAAFLLLRKR